MRMPRSSIEMSSPSAPALAAEGGFSILILGTRGGAGGFGEEAPSLSTIVSVTVQLNGGSDCRMPVVISSRIDSPMKRFQVMPTSQLA